MYRYRRSRHHWRRAIGAAITMSLVCSSLVFAAEPADPPEPDGDGPATPINALAPDDRLGALGLPTEAERAHAAELERKVMRAVLEGARAPAEFRVDETLVDQKAVDAGQTPAMPQSHIDPIETYVRYSVAGSVVASDTALAVSNVVVSIHDAAGYRLGQAVTDRLGDYEVSYYSSYTGPVRAYVNPAGLYPYTYMAEWYDNQPTRDLATPIAVVSNTVTPNIDFALDLGARILGTVTAADTGLPLTDVRVYVIGDDGVAIDYSGTDAQGRYTSGGLQTGSYRLYAAPDPDSPATSDYIGAYYASAPTLASADRVSVTAPTPTSGIDFALIRGAQITGVVTAEDTGLPLADVEVIAFDSAQGTAVSRAKTDASGQFTLRGIPSGSYKVYFATNRSSGPSREYYNEFFNDKRSFATADVVTVTAPSVLANIDAALGTDGQITGTISAADTGQPISNTWAYAEPAVPGYSYGLYPASVTASGQYSIRVPAGRYRVIFSPFFEDQAYCSQYYRGKVSAQMADIVEVRSSSTTANIDAALARSGTISGVVTAADTGAPLPYVLVRRTNVLNTYDSDNAPTNAQGSYALTGVCSGLHRVQFVPTDVIRERYAPEFYKDATASLDAETLTVLASASLAGIDAALEPAGALSGAIKAQDTGAALSAVWVDLFTAQGHYVASSQSTSEGTFRFAGLRPDVYTLRFDTRFAGPPAREYLSSTFDGKRDPASATPIAITTGVTTSITAELRKGAQISGMVTAGGRPMMQAMVALLDAGGRWLIGMSTDYSGAYRFIVDSGDYRVLVLPLPATTGGFAPQYFSGQHNLASAAPISITAPTAIADVDVALQPGGLIQGRVIDVATGSPIAGALIRVYDSDNPWLTLSSASSDGAGTYTVSTALGSGTYRIQASHGRYVAQFYGGQPTFGLSDAVTVTAPATTSGIDFSLTAVSALPVHKFLPVMLR